MNRSECLDKAKEIVNGTRQENYGNPESNFSTIAVLWDDYLRCKYSDEVHLTSDDVALMMILMKTARLMNNSMHLDSWVDIAGYAANGCEIYTGLDKTE